MPADKPHAQRPVIGSAHSWQPPRYHRRLTDAFGPYAELHREVTTRERIAGWLRLIAPTLLIVPPLLVYLFCVGVV